LNEKWVNDASSLIILEIKPVMDKMIEAGFRISVTLYENILEIVNE
jgi:predicted nucleic acid-binding protein